MNHRFIHLSRLPWLKFCAYCGLCALNNQATQKAISKQCPGLKDD